MRSMTTHHLTMNRSPGREVLFSTPHDLISDIQSTVCDRIPVLLFVAVNRGNFPSIEYIASTIGQKKQYRTYGIYLKSSPPENIYHAVFHCNGDLEKLDEIIYRSPPVYIYLQAHGRWIFLFRRIRALNPGMTIVHEVYDWMEQFIGDRRKFIENGVFDEEQILSIVSDEAYTRQHSDLLIYKDGGSWIEKRATNANARTLKLYPCPPYRWMRAPKISSRSNILRLVYAGQVMNNRAPPEIFGDLNYLHLIKELTLQGAELTIFNSVYSSRELSKDLFREYYIEMHKNPRFIFRDGIEMPRIISALHGVYDYGLVLFDFDQNTAVGDKHIKETMASKIFTYLSAGLPVVVSEELSNMANFVRENGIGIVVGKDDQKNLISNLRSIDAHRFTKNIKDAQKKYCIERFIDEFVAWMD